MSCKIYNCDLDTEDETDVNWLYYKSVGKSVLQDVKVNNNVPKTKSNDNQQGNEQVESPPTTPKKTPEVDCKISDGKNENNNVRSILNSFRDAVGKVKEYRSQSFNYAQILFSDGFSKSFIAHQEF